MSNGLNKPGKKQFIKLSFFLTFLVIMFGNLVYPGSFEFKAPLLQESTAKQPEKKPQLPDRYQKWLEEEVVYIITPVEKEIFLKLQNDRERDLFIEAFWKHRDPIPETEENEFKTEHYKRIEYANKYFGREAAKPGWRTDRGRIYIILGPPNDIQRHDMRSDIYNCEIWFYQGKTDLGLPPGFNILFFQKGGSGELQLYSPANDGPQSLLTSYWGDQSDYEAAYSKLREIDPNLAAISLSLIPGEENPSLGRPTLSSDLLLRQIELTPRRYVEDRYARRFFEYKDRVEVDYSVNYIDSDNLVKVFKDPAGFYMVHYSLEPKRLSVSQYDDLFVTNLKVNGTLSSLDDKIIYQFEKTYQVQMTEGQMRERQNLPLAIYDVFPCVPGEYKLSVLIKNEASKEFTSLEQTLSIPGRPGIEMFPPVLAFKASPVEETGGKIKAFLIGGQQLYIQANRVFTAKDQLAVALQVYGLTPALKSKASLRFQFIKDTQTQTQPFKEKIVPLSEVATLPDIIEIFSLSEFPPAHYYLSVSLLIDGREEITAKEEFDLTYLESLSRPWVLTRVLPSKDEPYYGYILGVQLYNLGRFDEARVQLEQALAKAPGNEELSRQLAQVYLEQKEFSKVVNLLETFLREDVTARYETYMIAAQALYNLGDYQKAIDVLDKAVNHYGTDIHLLNLIGDCYLSLGEKEAALVVWEKSLEMMADQPELKKKIQSIKQK
ncbi:MAG: GWxTD domain-containing protein [Acidobacteriota bacterium]|nr:GWxTD domain-containing protein [Acidobacteriota bacterium]